MKPVAALLPSRPMDCSRMADGEGHLARISHSPHKKRSAGLLAGCPEGLPALGAFARLSFVQSRAGCEKCRLELLLLNSEASQRGKSLKASVRDSSLERRRRWRAGADAAAKASRNMAETRCSLFPTQIARESRFLTSGRPLVSYSAVYAAANRRRVISDFCFNFPSRFEPAAMHSTRRSAPP